MKYECDITAYDEGGLEVYVTSHNVLTIAQARKLRVAFNAKMEKAIVKAEKYITKQHKKKKM